MVLGLVSKQIPEVLSMDNWSLKQIANIKGIGRIATRTGQAGTILNVALAQYNYNKSDKSWGDDAKIRMAYVSAILTLIPVTSKIGIAFGYLDASGALNGMYNLADKYQVWYDKNGFYELNTHIPKDIFNPSGEPIFSITYFNE